MVYRGQADANWGLTSSFDRECAAVVKDRPVYFKKLLSFFAYQLRQYGEDLDGMSDDDRAAIAQHYGMPTRLIDWSGSPYIAAFMAFSSALWEGRCGMGKRVAIWALDLPRFSELNGKIDPQFKLVKSRRLENDRVWRQSGLFVEAAGSGVALEAYLAERAGDDSDIGLIQWTIPTNQTAKALNDLILMGVTPATVYPDRDGASKYVRLRMALDRLEARDR
jgi:FRG domain